MPTILAYVHAYVPHHNAGAETTLHDILRYLVSEGWEAHVVIKSESPLISQAKKEEYVIDGVQVHRGDRKTLLHYIGKADITISHLECSERTHTLSRMWKKPSIHLVHNTHPLTKRWSASADAFIFNTNWIADEGGFSDKPAITIHPPVDPEIYQTTHGKSITLVNLWKDKGAEVFYEMAARFPDLPFLGVEGGYGEQEIRNLPNVTIMEHTPDMKRVYAKTKVILMPSKYESFGRVGVEAMASGIPVIAHPTPGLKESLGSAGTFADREDMGAWEEALSGILKPAKYGKKSKEALKRSEYLDSQRRSEMSVLPTFLSEIIRVKNGKVS